MESNEGNLEEEVKPEKTNEEKLDALTELIIMADEKLSSQEDIVTLVKELK